MKDSVTLLIIEDNQNHLADCKTVLEKIMAISPMQINPIFAEDLDGALALLPQADTVVTDVFFPKTKDGQEEPNGKVVVEHCLDQHIPVVWTSSTYHHGPKTNAVSEWGRKHGLEMYDCYGEGNAESAHKPWEQAILGALIIMIKIEDGTIFYENGCMVYSFVYDGEKEIFPASSLVCRFVNKTIEGGIVEELKKLVNQ